MLKLMNYENVEQFKKNERFLAKKLFFIYRKF